MQAIARGPCPKEAAEAVAAIERRGPVAQQADAVAKATRCFKVNLSEDGVSQPRWPWAAKFHLALKQALTVIRTNKRLGVGGGSTRTRPRSKGKQIEHIVFKSETGSEAQEKRKSTNI
eukprot:1010155-Pyramimonas_sp.AAC.1